MNRDLGRSFAADLDRYLTTEPTDRHDVDGCNDADCVACNGLPDAPVVLPLLQQARLTVLELRNLVKEMDHSARDIPMRYIRAIEQHADSLERSARAGST